MKSIFFFKLLSLLKVITERLKRGFLFARINVALPEATPSRFFNSSLNPPSLRSGSARKKNSLRPAQPIPLKPLHQNRLIIFFDIPIDGQGWLARQNFCHTIHYFLLRYLFNDIIYQIIVINNFTK